jgi:hypothetical protein
MRHGTLTIDCGSFWMDTTKDLKAEIAATVFSRHGSRQVNVPNAGIPISMTGARSISSHFKKLVSFGVKFSSAGTASAPHLIG